MRFLIFPVKCSSNFDIGTSMILRSHEKACMKDGSRKFREKFENTSKQILAVFPKVLRLKFFLIGPILILGIQLSF